MSYTDGFKARMIERMAGPEQISATALSKKVGVPQSTLSRWLWLRGVRRFGLMEENKRPGDRTRTAEEKLRIVLEASQLDEDELGALLRHEGIHEAQLKQ